MAADAVQTFRAIADPTRRAILDELRGGERAAGELGQRFPISQPALSQHLRVLRSVGLVVPRKEGRQRVYRLEAGPLLEVQRWLAHYERFWEQKLDALGQFLDETKED